MDLTVIVPTRNERQTIAELVDRVDESMRPLHVDYEVLVVDDSDDDTPELVQRSPSGRLCQRRRDRHTTLFSPNAASRNMSVEIGSMSAPLSVGLGSIVPVVLVAVTNGVLTANGTACESADGVPASTDGLTIVTITGGKEANSVYVDTSSEFGAGLLSAGGDFNVDLGAGDDELIVLGSDHADSILLGN